MVTPTQNVLKMRKDRANRNRAERSTVTQVMRPTAKTVSSNTTPGFIPSQPITHHPLPPNGRLSPAYTELDHQRRPHIDSDDDLPDDPRASMQATDFAEGLRKSNRKRKAPTKYDPPPMRKRAKVTQKQTLKVVVDSSMEANNEGKNVKGDEVSGAQSAPNRASQLSDPDSDSDAGINDQPSQRPQHGQSGTVGKELTKAQEILLIGICVSRSESYGRSENKPKWWKTTEEIFKARAGRSYTGLQRKMDQLMSARKKELREQADGKRVGATIRNDDWTRALDRWIVISATQHHQGRDDSRRRMGLKHFENHAESVSSDDWDGSDDAGNTIEISSALHDLTTTFSKYLEKRSNEPQDRPQTDRILEAIKSLTAMQEEAIRKQEEATKTQDRLLRKLDVALTSMARKMDVRAAQHTSDLMMIKKELRLIKAQANGASKPAGEPERTD